MMKKSAQDPPGVPSSESSKLFCVICRVEKKVIAVRPTSINDDNTTSNSSGEPPLSNVIPTIITEVDTNKCPIYQLTNCKHKFCLPCIHAYVTSKLVDKQISIPCCHFHVSGSSVNVHQCNVVIDEVDIYNLLHIAGVDDYYYCNDEDESSVDVNHHEEVWSPQKIQGSTSLKEIRMNNIDVENSSTPLNFIAKKKDVEGIVQDELWMKYTKLKFDLEHGTNTVRRCPQCDEGILFDVHAMKLFQDQFFSTSFSSSNVVVVVDGDDVPSTSNTKRRKRILNRVWRWRNNVVTDSGDGGTASSAKEGSNIVANDLSITESPIMAREYGYTMETRDKQEGINMRDDTDDTSSNGVEPILSSSSANNNNNNNNHNKEDAYIKHDLGDSAKHEDEANNEQDLSYMTKTTTQNKNYDCEAQISHLNENSPTELCYSCETVENPTLKSEILPTPVRVKSTTPCVTCPTCTTNFCYFHSNAHAFGTPACISYHTNSIESDRINQEYASQTLRAKSCPTCGIAVSKEGGCNQMKCCCGTHFCWICSAIVDDGAFPEHFRWWNITGCANMQLDETNDPMTLTIIWARVLSIFQIVVLGIPAVILTIISIIVCPCIAIGGGATNRERVVNIISFWGSFLSSMLLLPFASLGLLIMAAVYCFVAALSYLLKLTRSMRRRSTELSVVDIPRRQQSNSNRNPNTALRDLSSIIDRMEEGRGS